MKFLKVITILFLLFSNFSFAQISNFTLQVTATSETCLGNGSLTMSVSGTTAGATMSYAVYLQPNLTTPIAVLTTPILTGLNSGNYTVIATQSLGSQTGIQQANVTIQNLIVPLTYTIESVKVNCGNDGQITVFITSGVAVSYEILSGPIIVSPQTSNVFTSLPAGQYQIRVYNNCGDAVVQSYTLLANVLNIVIDSVTFPSAVLPSCSTISVSNFYGSINGSVVSYPLQVQYTVFPPGGGTPTLISQTIQNGQLTGTVLQDIPFYHGQSYLYNIQITDSCGNVFLRNNNVVNKSLSLGVQSLAVSCTGVILSIGPSNYLPPYSINFIQAPAGFNVLQANALHPGPFTDSSIEYGSSTNPVPEGIYTIQVTDACGRSATLTTEISIETGPPTILVSSGCIVGSILIQPSLIAPSPSIVSVILLSAPSAYPNSLPENLSSFIVGGSFVLNTNIFEGTYVFQVIDSCGDTYTLLGVVQTSNEFEISVSQRPGCDIGFGGFRIISDKLILSVNLMNAPATFQGTLPLNLTANINSTGAFNFGNVPAGNYTFEFEYMCGSQIYTSTKVVFIEGYQITTNNVTVFENCGSFDLQVQHTSNGTLGQSFWLQKQDPITGNWGHPLTGIVMLPGILPNPTNSYLLVLNSINLNIAVSGHFRVIKRFQSFTQTGGIANCVSVLDEFDFNDGPSIIDVYSFVCANGNLDTIIVAEGVPPLTYRITEKNGVPFVVNNGTSNIFLNLEGAIYNFQIQDVCGNIANSLYEINALPPLEIVVSQLCNGQNGTLSLPSFPFITYQWWKGTNPQNVLSITNELVFSPYNSVTNSGQYFVSITSQNANSCINQILSITIDASSELPNAGQNVNSTICEGTQVLDLFSLFTSYDAGGTWVDLSNSGALVGSTVDASLLPPGSFQYQYTVTDLCNQVAQAIVTIQINPIPSSPIIAAVSPICEGEELQLSTTAIVGATYYWIGPNGFESNLQNPIISAATIQNEGDYFLYVSLNDCDSEISVSTVEVTPKPIFSIQGEVLICNNQSLTLTINSENFNANEVVFNWYLNGTFLESESVGVLEINQPGLYSVVTSIGDCEATQQTEIIEKVIDIPIVFEEKCSNNRKTLAVANASEFSNYTFTWTGPGSFSAQGPIIDISEIPAGYYEVTVTDPFGCSVSLGIDILKTNCIIPKGISPNNDGMNDSFDLSDHDVLNLKIFNRYGMKMYELNNYINEWYGQTDNGSTLPSAAYYYLVYFTDGTHKTGWVYLTREK